MISNPALNQQSGTQSTLRNQQSATISNRHSQSAINNPSISTPQSAVRNQM